MLAPQADRGDNREPQQQHRGRATEQVEAATRQVGAPVGAGELLVRRVGADPEALRRDDVQGSVERSHVRRHSEGEDAIHIERDDPAVRPREQLQRGAGPAGPGLSRATGEPRRCRTNRRPQGVGSPGLADDDDPDLAAALVSAGTSASPTSTTSHRVGVHSAGPAGPHLRRRCEVVAPARKNVEPARGELSEDHFLADGMPAITCPSCFAITASRAGVGPRS